MSNVPRADLGKPAGRISTQSRRRLGLLEALAPQVLRHAASRAPRSLLDALRDETGIDWTFFSPAALIEEGPRLGHYRTGTDRLVTDAQGQSRISFADYAIAMADELEQHRHPRARFTAAY